MNTPGEAAAQAVAENGSAPSAPSPEPDNQEILVRAGGRSLPPGSKNGNLVEYVVPTIPLKKGKSSKGAGIPATMLSRNGLTLLSGLYVEGNVLKGTVLVKFKEGFRAEGDEERVIKQFRLINQKTPDGYEIRLTIREKTILDTLKYPFTKENENAYVKVLFSNDISRTNCGPRAAACYDPNNKYIKIEVGAGKTEVSHEFNHNLGLDHNSIPGSLMFGTLSPSNPTALHPQEIRNMVNAYRKN